MGKRRAETTGKKQPAKLFQPGESGNPAGRPKGSRNKFAEEFVSDLYADWLDNGIEVLRRVREKQPSAYLKVAASLIPHHVKVEHEFSNLTDEQIEQRLREINAAIETELGIVAGATEAAGRKPASDTKH